MFVVSYSTRMGDTREYNEEERKGKVMYFFYFILRFFIMYKNRYKKQRIGWERGHGSLEEKMKVERERKLEESIFLGKCFRFGSSSFLGFAWLLDLDSKLFSLVQSHRFLKIYYILWCCFVHSISTTTALLHQVHHFCYHCYYGQENVNVITISTHL